MTKLGGYGISRHRSSYFCKKVMTVPFTLSQCTKTAHFLPVVTFEASVSFGIWELAKTFLALKDTEQTSSLVCSFYPQVGIWPPEETITQSKSGTSEKEATFALYLLTIRWFQALLLNRAHGLCWHLHTTVSARYGAPSLYCQEKIQLTSGCN